MKKTSRVLHVLAILSAVTACSGPFSDLSNFDLKKEYNQCDYNKLTAAGAQRCNNIKKECDVRKKANGFRC